MPTRALNARQRSPSSTRTIANVRQGQLGARSHAFACVERAPTCAKTWGCACRKLRHAQPQVFALACDRMRSTCANACKRVCARSDALKASEAHNMCARERGSRTHANIYTVQFYAHHNNNTCSLGCGCCKMQHAQPQMPCFAIVACMFCDRGVTQGWQKYVTHVAWVAIRCVGVTHSVCHTHTQHTPTHTHKCAVFNGLSNFNIIVPGVYTHIHIITKARVKSVCRKRARSEDRPCKRALARHIMAF